ncbi:MAG: hypothetical protein HFF83_03640 [Oscillibacter sp.]|jgi:hypothetical protein|nr:hypothetical protein [Oscillibacter sp.]
MNPIRESETDRKIEQAAERFWSAFQMTENGRVKSTLLLYSFCLCWVFFGVYGVAYAFLVPPVHALTAGWPILAVHLAEILVPSVLATALCGLTWLLPGDRRLLPATYLWMAALTIACLIAMLVIMNGEAAGLVLQFFALYTLAPLGLGGALSAFLYCRRP